MKKQKTMVFLIVFAVFAVSLLLSHGLSIDIQMESPFVVVQAKYSGGLPTAGATVTVMAPGREEPFQKGACDNAGRFVFLPDKTGEWTVIVDDGRGHRQQRILAIDTPFFEPKTAPKADPVEPQMITKEMPVIPLWIKVCLGLSIIFGLTGLFYGFKSGRAAKADRS